MINSKPGGPCFPGGPGGPAGPGGPGLHVEQS